MAMSSVQVLWRLKWHLCNGHSSVADGHLRRKARNVYESGRRASQLHLASNRHGGNGEAAGRHAPSSIAFSLLGQHKEVIPATPIRIFSCLLAQEPTQPWLLCGVRGGVLASSLIFKGMSDGSTPSEEEQKLMCSFQWHCAENLALSAAMRMAPLK